MLCVAYFSESTMASVRSFISSDQDNFSGLWVNAAGGVSSEDTGDDSEMTCENGYANG